MHFDGSLAGFGVVLGNEDDTANSEAPPLGELKLMPRSIGKSVLDKYFFQDCAIESGRTLRPGENAAAGQLRFDPGGPAALS